MNRPNSGEELLTDLYAAFGEDGRWSDAEHKAMTKATEYVTRVNVCASVLRVGGIPREYEREPTPFTRMLARRLGRGARHDDPPRAA